MVCSFRSPLISKSVMRGGILLLMAVLVPGILSAQEGDFIGTTQVYLTPDQARAKVFPKATFFKREMRPLGADLKALLVARLGRPIAQDSLGVDLAYDAADNLLGYAVIAEEIGKYRPITFMVGINPAFQVQKVAVLVYRESRGGEVRRARFLRQYAGKSATDPIRINRDIINITGATMSVRSLNFGVRKVLYLTQALYGDS
ncbi:MAG: FMN-binding protein [Candidatus Latescibacteria bacterium]|nr:FMN-binding protein [Candidatus Latescibacterota bacterium]